MNELLRVNDINVAEVTESFIEHLLEGRIDWRDAMKQKKVIETMLDEVFADDRVREYIKEEYAKEGCKKVAYGSYEITKIEKKVSYTYDKCNDKILERLQADEQYNAVKNKIEERQKLLRELRSMMVETDPETGETFEKYPAAYKFSEYFQVSLMKAKK